MRLHSVLNSRINIPLRNACDKLVSFVGFLSMDEIEDKAVTIRITTSYSLYQSRADRIADTLSSSRA